MALPTLLRKQNSILRDVAKQRLPIPQHLPSTPIQDRVCPMLDPKSHLLLICMSWLLQ